MSGKILFIFDLDETLWDGKQLYPDVVDILTTLRNQGHYIYIATFNLFGPETLKMLNIVHLFHGGAYGRNATKLQMIKQIMQHAKKKNRKFNAVHFYDDLRENTDLVHRNGLKETGMFIKSVQVINGVNWAVL